MKKVALGTVTEMGIATRNAREYERKAHCYTDL